MKKTEMVKWGRVWVEREESESLIEGRESDVRGYGIV